MTPSRKPKTRSYQVVRWAILGGISPTPNHDDVATIFRAFRVVWAARADEYLQCVAAGMGLPASKLDLDRSEDVRLSRDGDTPVIDFPRLKSIPGIIGSIEVRLSVAICTVELSSKIWSRVGSPVKGPGLQQPDVDVTKTYRNIARISTRWGLVRLREVLTASGHRLRLKGRLEVSVLGTNDPALGQDLTHLSESSTSADDLIANPDARRRLSRYFRPLTGAALSSAMFKRNPDAFWFSSTSVVTSRTGALEPREVLFLMRDHQGRAQAVGLAYDEVAPAELAQESGLKVGRWIANRV